MVPLKNHILLNKVHFYGLSILMLQDFYGKEEGDDKKKFFIKMKGKNFIKSNILIF